MYCVLWDVIWTALPSVFFLSPVAFISPLNYLPCIQAHNGRPALTSPERGTVLLLSVLPSIELDCAWDMVLNFVFHLHSILVLKNYQGCFTDGKVSAERLAKCS